MESPLVKSSLPEQAPAQIGQEALQQAARLADKGANGVQARGRCRGLRLTRLLLRCLARLLLLLSCRHLLRLLQSAPHRGHCWSKGLRWRQPRCL